MPRRQNNKRKFPNGTGRRPDLTRIKREEAIERQEVYDKLSVVQKIERLDRMFGKDNGAKRERTRLEATKEAK